ncbi:MAG: hypothetical protein ACTSYL_07690 [Candidatus Thorarchaeota archaeon]
MRGIAQKIDGLLRIGSWNLATELVDAAILHDALGLSDQEIVLLRKGALWLRNRRYERHVRQIVYPASSISNVS